MSDDYHRPTLTFPSGAYNATQVRLYGLSADIGISIPTVPATFSGTGMNVEVAPGNSANPEDVVLATKILEDNPSNAARRKILNGTIPFPPIPIRITYSFKIDIKNFGISTVTTASDTFLFGVSAKQKTSCGVIVGYAYEGHTYDLPKPKIMLLPTFPEVSIPDDDSGYDLKEDEGYAVWLVDKLDQCVEFEMNQGFVEQLVLEANLPGKRSPAMYASKAQMGHRSGKLND